MSEIACSFCAKARREVRALIGGPGTLAICDECVRLCVDIIDEDRALKDAPKRRPFEDDVVGHASAKKVVRAALRRYGGRATRILLVGPSGCGKTALLRALLGEDRPACFTDASGLSEAGYIGDGVEHAISELARVAGYDAQLASQGILLLDGIARIAAARPRGIGRDLAGEGVQRALLPLLEGRTLETPGQDPHGAPLAIATSGITIVAALSCDLERGMSELELRERVRAQGFLPAFVARFDRVVALEMPAADEMERILDRLLAPIDLELARIGSRMAIDRAALRALAERAASSEEGAWRLRSAIDRAIEDALLAPSGTFRPELLG